ncbi:MAG: iron-sulfur cluster assembly protein [Chloroflexi bacterium]|nr:iron-sulfur cluster assembly protein [Chloroflexota bacterium]MBV9544692.1 iron-sulfur cluster assembly protein [Chloroflexota bacterium]
MSQAAVVSEHEVLGALRGVIDPELDESIVELQFVDSVRVEDDYVEVVLRLPTFWCAPNFAYLMACDARDQVRQVAGRRQVQVRLKDHFASDEISRGVSEDQPFDHIFADNAANDDLTELRRLFQTKAFTMRLEQLVQFLLDQGLSPVEVSDLRLADLVSGSDAEPLVLRLGDQVRRLRGGASLARSYLGKRRQLGLDQADDAVLVSDERGMPIAADALLIYLQQARRQRISIAFNSMFCRGLLETRYGGNGER